MLIKTKILTLKGFKYFYRLPDWVYGEFLLCDNGVPICYVNFFDEKYKDILSNIQHLNISLYDFINRIERKYLGTSTVAGFDALMGVIINEQLVEFNVPEIDKKWLEGIFDEY